MDNSTSPNTFTSAVFKMLETALEYGISELDFWEMTIAELQRLVKAKNIIQKRELQQKASFDYIQANLIIAGISKVLDGKGELATLQEAYPELFDDIAEEQAKKLEEKKAELSVLRFKQFAQFHNDKHKKANTEEVQNKVNE